MANFTPMGAKTVLKMPCELVHLFTWKLKEYCNGGGLHGLPTLTKTRRKGSSIPFCSRPAPTSRALLTVGRM